MGKDRERVRAVMRLKSKGHKRSAGPSKYVDWEYSISCSHNTFPVPGATSPLPTRRAHSARQHGDVGLSLGPGVIGHGSAAQLWHANQTEKAARDSSRRRPRKS
jgi:hypothetical protein